METLPWWPPVVALAFGIALFLWNKWEMGD